jgi:hypothetical protein
MRDMSDRSDRTAHFATLFESITGQTTITEHQRSDIQVRIDDTRSERSIAEYIETAATADGFDDVIDEPETS